MIRRKLGRMWKAIQMELREHKSSFVVYFVLRIAVIIMMILQIYNKNYENVFLCVLTLFLFIVPSFVQVNFKIELPTTLEIIILLFIFAAEILGEISSYYIKYPLWDTVLHIINGFLAAAIGFSMVDILSHNEKIKFDLSPLFMAIVAFCFSMTIGIVWEFFEFGMDTLLGYDMQKDTVIHTINTVYLDPTRTNTVVTIDNIHDVAINGESLGIDGYLDIGLYDTMKDLFVNFIGAAVFSAIGYFYVKARGKGKLVKRFIPTLKKKDADFLRIIKEESESENKEG